MNDNEHVKILLAGGAAGVVTWASIFPLDVIKTRLQSPDQPIAETYRPAQQPLLRHSKQITAGSSGVARQIYREEGFHGFFRGLGVCSVRAFVVNAVQVSSPSPKGATFC